MSNKNYKGGYKIVDLGGLELTTGGTISGIYKKIEASYRKPILLSGIVISGVEKNDVMSKPEVVGTSYVFRDIYGYDVTITDEDVISLASTQWATRAYVDLKSLSIDLISDKISSHFTDDGVKLFRGSFDATGMGGTADVTYAVLRTTSPQQQQHAYYLILYSIVRREKSYGIKSVDISENTTFSDIFNKNNVYELAHVE